MNTDDTRDWRPLIFLAVLISHLVIVFLLIRAALQQPTIQEDRMTAAWTSLCAVSDLATHQRINKFLAEGTVNLNTFRH